MKSRGLLDRWYKLAIKIPFAFAMLFTMGLMFLTAVDVIGRFFGRPISGSYQISELTQLWIICLAWPLTVSMSSHVSVTFIISRLPTIAKQIAGVLVNFVAMAIFAIIAWKGFEMVMRSREQAELVNILDIPIYPFQIAVPIGAALSFLVYLVQLVFLAAGRNVSQGNEQ